jgi:hypothetical protein
VSPAVAGVAVLLGCLVLPAILGVLSVATEQAAGDKATQDLHASATGTAASASTGQTPTPAGQARPRLLDQHYYFVNGCVSAPIDCGKANGGTWGEYYTELGHLYGEAAAQVAGQEQLPTFDEWAKTHTHFLSGQTAAAGAYEIEQALPQNKSQADIHMIGTSAGGAAIFFYLSQAIRGNVELDRRVRSGVAVDSPLGFQFPFRSSDFFLGVQAGAMKSDVELGIGEWAKAANISLFTVNTPNDIVNHETVPDVPDDNAPVYPPEGAPPTPNPDSPIDRLTKGGTWHVYTGSHMAESTRQFMEEHWR